MTLTVPTSNARPGRAADIRVEANSQGSDAFAQLGQVAQSVGDAIVEDRLRRTTARIETDMTKELGDLRLRMEQESDPDAIDATWAAETSEMKSRYLDGQDVRVKDRVDISFDQLANSHAGALGQRAVNLRQSQQEATWIEYRQTALNQATGADPDTRDTMVANGLQMIDDLVAAGSIDAEEAALRKVEFIGAADNASAVALIDSDPAGFIEAADQGLYAGLDGERLARFRVQAQGQLDAQAAEMMRREATATREREAAIGKRLDELIDIAGADRRAVDEGFLNDPVVAAHPKYGEAMAALSLRAERADLAAATPAELDAAIAEERGKPVVRKYQTERLAVLERFRDEAAAGWATDPVAQANRVGRGLEYPGLPDFATADPDELSAGLAARVRHGAALAEAGYVDAPVILSREEQEELREAASVAADPAQRVALAAALQSGLADAPAGTIERVVDDPVFVHAAGLMGATGNRRLAQEIFRGEQVIDQGNVILPPVAERLQSVFVEAEDLFADLDAGEAAQAAIMASADALYAARRRRIDPANNSIEGLDEDLYRQALHDAMGGTGRHDDVNDSRGGIFEVRGHRTILPPDVNAGQVIGSMELLGIEIPKTGIAKWARRSFSPEKLQRQLKAISTDGELPVIDGMPLDDPETFEDVYLQALGGDRYALVYPFYDGPQVLQTAAGEDFTISLRRLVTEAPK